MGKIIKRKIQGMSWWMKTGLVLTLTLVATIVLYQSILYAAPTANGRLVHSNNATTPLDKAYTVGTNIFAAGATMQTGAAQAHMVDRAAPTRYEHIAGYVTPGGVLYIQRWDGTAWSAEWNVTVGGDGVNGRRFDIAYEKTSGRAMVVYSTAVNGNAGAEMAYNIWNGTAWAGPVTITSARFNQAAQVTAIKMKSNPLSGSNEIALTAADSGTTTANTSVLTSFIWNGTTWTEPGAAHTTATTTYLPNTTGQLFQNDLFDLAYESLTGDLLVCFTAGGTAQQWYVTKSAAGAWVAASSYGLGAAAPMQMVAESDPLSDKILVMWNRSGFANVYANVWSGTAIGTNTTVSNANGITTAINKKTIAAKWLVVGGVSYAVPMWATTTAGTIGYAYYTGTTWTSGASGFTRVTGTGTAPQWMDVDRDPLSADTLMLTFSDTASDLWAKRLVLTAGPTFTWSNADGGTAITATLASITSKNFSFSYDFHPLTSTITTCAGCHGNPPVDNAARVGGVTGQFKGNHGKHTAAPVSLTCINCHVANATYDHSDGNIQIASPLRAVTGESYGQATHPVTNAPTFSSCTTYCHSQGTSKTTNAGESRTGAVSTPLVPATWATTTTTCASCHGNPPSYTTGATTWGAAKANSHQGTTHAAQVCTRCHNSVTGPTTVTTGHADGLYTVAAASVGYTYAAAGGSCNATGTGCHNTTSIQWGTSLGCIDCHAAGQGTRRALSTEITTYTWSHKKTAGVWNSSDCCVCHMEGDPATGSTNATYHKNNQLDFRDPDTGVTIKGVTFAGAPGAYTSTATDATAATFVRNTGTNALEAFAQAVQVNLCLKCHDANGAASSLAWVPGGTATQPFGTAGGTALDVNAHFATTNAAYHPVTGKQNNSYANANTMETPWNFTKTAGNNTSYGYLLTCWDCHDSSTTARTIGGANASVSHGGAVTLRATYDATSKQSTKLCVVCHKQSVYWGTDGGATAGQGYTHVANNGLSALSIGSAQWNSGGYHDHNKWAFFGCTVCHGATDKAGVMPARPARAENVHGSNTVASGGTTWTTSGAKPYSFLRNTNAWSDWNLSTKTCNMNGGCRATTGTYTPGGTY